MTKAKQVTIKLDVRSAAAVRQVLFEAQRGYSYEHVPQRITDIRAVVQDIDDSIRSVLESE
jgi:hypothetical protein